MGYRNRGIKAANLYVINHTKMPAMLIECYFIDSENDMVRYNAEDIANAIVKGLVGQTSNSIANATVQQGNLVVSSDGSEDCRKCVISRDFLIKLWMESLF